MSLDWFSHQDHIPTTFQQVTHPSDWWEIMRPPEDVNTDRAEKEALFFMNKSSLFQKDSSVQLRITSLIAELKETRNIEWLHHITEVFKQERHFLLSQIRFRAGDVSTGEQLLRVLQRDFLEKMIYSKERQEERNPDKLAKNLVHWYYI